MTIIFLILMILFVLRNKINKHYFAIYFVFTCSFLFWRLIKTRFVIPVEDFLSWILFLNLLYFSLAFLIQFKKNTFREIINFFKTLDDLWISYLMELYHQPWYQNSLEILVRKFIFKTSTLTKYFVIICFIFIPIGITLIYEIFVLKQIRIVFFCFIWSTIFYKIMKNFIILGRQLSWTTMNTISLEQEFSYYDNDWLGAKGMKIVVERHGSETNLFRFIDFLDFRQFYTIGYKMNFLILKLNEIRNLFFKVLFVFYTLTFLFFSFESINSLILIAFLMLFIFFVIKIYFIFVTRSYRERKILVHEKKLYEIIEETQKLYKGIN